MIRSLETGGFKSGEIYKVIVTVFLVTSTHLSAETFLDKVVVTPLKKPTKIFDTFNNVQVITSKDIKLQGYKINKRNT